MEGDGYSRGWERGNDSSTSRPVKPSSGSVASAPRKAVPPGYLHDLLHSRHLMRTVGLRKQSESRNMIPNPLVNVPIKSSRGSQQYRTSTSGTPKLPELFRQRKVYLDRQNHSKNRHPKRDGERERSRRGTGTATVWPRERGREGGRPGERGRNRVTEDRAQEQTTTEDPINLLSLPEELLLKIVCYLTHEEAKPLFLVCKELSQTLKNAIQFHFNFATPTAMAASKGEYTRGNDRNVMPLARRPQKKRAVTAYADVLGHLKKGGQRNVIEKEAPTSSTHSLAAPRALMFNTPQTTPTSLQQQLPALSGISVEAATTPVKKRPKR